MASVGQRRAWHLRLVSIVATLMVVLTTGGSGVSGAGKIEELKRAGVVRVGWGTFKPMLYLDTDSNKIVGMWAEITEMMVSEGLGLKTQWMEGTWATIATGIQTNKWDLAVSGLTDERSAIAQPTKPFASVGYRLLVKEGSPAKSWQELDQPGKRISVSQGSSTDQLLTGVIKNATIVRVRQEQAILELLSNKVDAQAVTSDYGIGATRQYPGLRLLQAAFGQTYIGWYVPKGADDVRAAVDAWMETAKKRGLVKQLIEKWKLEGEDPA